MKFCASPSCQFLRFQLQTNEIPVFSSFHLQIFWHTTGSRRRFICPVSPKILLGASVFALFVSSTIADPFPVSGPVVQGKVARIYSAGQAAAPKKAPVAIKRAIWAANQLCSKPYQYGGGHRSFDDPGYDSSSTVSYAL